MATNYEYEPTATWSNWVTTGTNSAISPTQTWYGWQTATGTSATTTSGTDQCWGTWTADEGTSASTSVWTTWQVTGSEITYAAPTQVGRMVAPTPEEIAAQQLRQAEAKRLADELEVKRQAARAKAEATLRELLTPEQEQAWQENRHIFVMGQSGKRYRIKEGMSHNFHEVTVDGVPIKEFCAHVDLSSRCNVIDNVIAQLLALKYNEAMIVKKANVWDVSRPERRVVQRSS
ncbi:MAG: hypothetical protein OEY69_00090 [Candidatus Krumholzibacteria bacterium]|nr:hypothetical protein [Candidatus Krumholzibacteria bacterium]